MPVLSAEQSIQNLFAEDPAFPDIDAEIDCPPRLIDCVDQSRNKLIAVVQNGHVSALTKGRVHQIRQALRKQCRVDRRNFTRCVESVRSRTSCDEKSPEDGEHSDDTNA